MATLLRNVAADSRHASTFQETGPFSLEGVMDLGQASDRMDDGDGDIDDFGVHSAQQQQHRLHLKTPLAMPQSHPSPTAEGFDVSQLFADDPDESSTYIDLSPRCVRNHGDAPDTATVAENDAGNSHEQDQTHSSQHL